MWMKKPMWMAVIAASVATILLYGLSPDVAIHGSIKGATARATIETLVVFYSITFLQRMMEKRTGNIVPMIRIRFNLISSVLSLVAS